MTSQEEGGVNHTYSSFRRCACYIITRAYNGSLRKVDFSLHVNEIFRAVNSFSEGIEVLRICLEMVAGTLCRFYLLRYEPEFYLTEFLVRKEQMRFVAQGTH